MCDYSLENVASRPAVVGDKLTVTKFISCTTGFSAAEDAKTAVCLLPGTELAFDAPIQTKIYTYENMGVHASGTTFDHSVAVFTQILRENMTWSYHKDAIEMADGTKVLLNDLASDQHATVLQLPAESTISHVELPADCEASEPGPAVPATSVHEYTD